jgi:hypothetical protein
MCHKTSKTIEYYKIFLRWIIKRAHGMRLTELVAFDNKLKSLAVEHWVYDSDEQRAHGWSALMSSSNLTSLSLLHLTMSHAQFTRLARCLPRLAKFICHSAADGSEEEIGTEPIASLFNDAPLDGRLLGGLTSFTCARIRPESSLLPFLAKLPHLSSLMLGDVDPIEARHFVTLAPAHSLVCTTLNVINKPATLSALVGWLSASPRLSTLHLTWSDGIPSFDTLSQLTSLTSLTLSGTPDCGHDLSWPTFSCLHTLDIRRVAQVGQRLTSIPVIYPHLRELRLPYFTDTDFSIEALSTLTQLRRLDMDRQALDWFTESKLVRLRALTRALPHLHTLSLRRLSPTATVNSRNLKAMFRDRPNVKLNLH